MLPCASVAVSVTVVFPSANWLPEFGAALAIPTPSTASDVADGVNVATAPAALVASTVTSACAAITGGVVSCTVTLKEDEAVFPSASIAETVTVVAPTPKVEPDMGEAVVATAP